MKRFEYSFITIDPDAGYRTTSDLETTLCKLGAGGWELVSTIVGRDKNHVLYFKKELPDE